MPALALAALLWGTPLWATPTENNSIRVLPALGKIVVDGKTGDWDLSGGLFICDNVETQRDTLAVWTYAMYDRDNLYLLAHFKDETPLNNPGQTLADFGWNGDCLQVRFLTHPDTPDQLNSVINAWKGVDGKDVVQLDSPLTHHGPWGEDVKPQGAQQAFQTDADGKGYTQEIALPWKLLMHDGQPPEAGSLMHMTFEPNFTVGVGGRMSLKDNFTAGRSVDRVFQFMNTPGWGPALFVAKAKVKPQPVRLADGREFPTRLAGGAPVVAWAGLMNTSEAPGFKPITFAMPSDGYVSLHIKNAQGQVVRQLLNAAFFTKGPHTVKWDGLPTPNLRLSGPPLPAGAYTWSALFHTGIGLKLRGWANNSGQVPWDNGPASNWGGDEGVPVTVAADDWGVYLGWTGAEAGHALVATDTQGRVRWHNTRGGMGGVKSVAADGGVVYVLDGSAGSLYKLAAADGSYLSWGAGDAADLAVKSLGGGDAQAPLDKADSIAALGGKLFLAFGAAGKVAVVDGKTGTLEKMLDVPAPGSLWARSATQLYAVSGGNSVVVANPQDGRTKEVLAGLYKAAGLSGAADGTLYVGVGGAADASTDQVQVFDPSGKRLHTLGRAGGRVSRGAWDPNSFLNVSALAVDSTGGLWAAENTDYPKRFSTWNPQDGTFRKEFFGPTLYGGLGGAINPRAPNLMVGSGCEWRLDPKTGQATCLGVITREGMGASRFATGANGRLYLVVAPGWYVFGPSPFITIYERLGDADYKPRARFDFEGKDSAAKTHYWADANGDERQQPDEVTTVPGELQFNNWYLGVTPTLTLYRGRSQWKVAGFTPAGAPLYNLASPVALPATDPGMADSQNTDVGLGSADDRLVLYEGNYLADRTTFRAFDIASGRMLWSYPNNFVGVHGSHNATGPEVGMIRGSYGVLGTAKLPDPIGNVWAIGTNVGEWHLLTGDGFYLTRLFEPDALKVHFPEQPVPGADMSEAPPGLGGEDFGGSLTLGTDGKLYVQAGKTAFWNLEVTGLESVRALPGGRVSLVAADLPKARAIREAQLQVVQGKKTASVKRGMPAFSGNLDADFKGSDVVTFKKGDDAVVRSAAAWDAQTFSVGWDVAGSRAWTNSAKAPEDMYLSGDTVDLQLGTDPAAPKDRSEAALGDLRLSIGSFGGKPTAVLYRRVSAQKRPKPFNSGVFHNYVMDYVGVVPDVKITVTRGDKGTTIEAAVPLAVLGLKPTEGLALRGDFGATYGDPAGQRTRLRVYWSNQQTGIVDDAVAELMMQPRNWGDLKLVP